METLEFFCKPMNAAPSVFSSQLVSRWTRDQRKKNQRKTENEKEQVYMSKRNAEMGKKRESRMTRKKKNKGIIKR